MTHRAGPPLALAALLSVSLHAASTITVDRNGGADFTEVQPALDAAKDGDMVLVRPGEYLLTQSIDFNRLHVSDDPVSPPVKDLVLRSEKGPGATILRIYGLAYLFLGGRAPPPPSQPCGPDPTRDPLGCLSFPRCP